ncbi:MAG: ABC transporter permease [Bacillota bacterium]|nr:ABC transporter permease [Bacillota bacterium]
MKSMITIIKEQFRSIYLILRLSAFEMKSANTNNYLGRVWEVLNPLISLGIYYFIFGVGVRGGRSIIMENGQSVSFFSWLITGMSFWFFANPSIGNSSRSIYSRIGLISKMSFPMSVIPSYVIMANFYSHLMLVTVVTIYLQFTGFPLTIKFLQIPYFMISALAFLFSLSLITSTLSTIVRDFQQIVYSILKMLLYLTPLLWHTNKLVMSGVDLTFVLKLNPLTYLAEGYRSALLGTTWYEYAHPYYTMYFWGLVLILFFIGSILHLKFRDRFVDYL